ncbi:MAG: hypothetical protein R3D25_23230 [Geminicoccaceae bacterium]
MQRQLLIIGLAAAASATLYLSLTTGVLGTPLFAYFVQLPLLFVGLSFGLAPAGLASFGSAGLVMAFGGGIAALVFIVIQVAPCLLTTRQALLSRVGQDGKTEWYPARPRALPARPLRGHRHGPRPLLGALEHRQHRGGLSLRR